MHPWAIQEYGWPLGADSTNILMSTLQRPPMYSTMPPLADPTLTEMPITAVVRQCAVEVLWQSFSCVSLL